MAKTFNRMRIDVNEKPNSICINPVQNDTQSRYLDVSLYNNGLPIDLTGEVVRINFKKEDGTTFFNQGEITNAAEGRCQFVLTNEVLSEAKTLKAQISIWSGEGEILSTQVFLIYVTESIRNDEEVESTNEFGVLVVLFQEIQNALDLMQTIVGSFGEPGEKAAEFEAETFWQMLEVLAQRADTKKIIKSYVNSTIDTSGFIALDKLVSTSATSIKNSINNVSSKADASLGGVQTFTSDGTFTVPADVTKILVTACAGGEGGNYRSSSTYSAGEGGEWIYKHPFTVTPRAEISIVVGKGGVGSSGSDASKNPGGNTVIGTLITLLGGGIKGNKLGGKPGSGSAKTAEEGQGSPGLMPGGISRGSYTYSGTTYLYPGGGGSLGCGADGYASSRNKTPLYGGGGTCYDDTSTGGDGIVIIEW